ncbi:MAG: hydroxypyruvate isomerase family protein [Gemmatimonadaceae bacterium]
MHRREALQIMGAAAAMPAVRGRLAAPPLRAGRIKQSVSRWPYSKIPLPEFCAACKNMGIVGIDLLQPEEWAVVREAGLTPSMGYPTKRNDFIPTGFNDPANHPMLLRELEATIPLAAKAGVPNVIAMFGNRNGRSDSDAIAACVQGLSAIKALAEEQKVNVCVELLNSKVDHPGYQGDHTAFGVAVMQGVGSSRVKLLYDIYHMQIMEGDVIRTIRTNAQYIGHFHTGGVPGRHELDDTQELNWHAVARAIADTNFDGFMAHEFVPTKPPLESLHQAVETCTV